MKRYEDEDGDDDGARFLGACTHPIKHILVDFSFYILFNQILSSCMLLACFYPILLLCLSLPSSSPFLSSFFFSLSLFSPLSQAVKVVSANLDEDHELMAKLSTSYNEAVAKLTPKLEVCNLQYSSAVEYEKQL